MSEKDGKEINKMLPVGNLGALELQNVVIIVTKMRAGG